MKQKKDFIDSLTTILVKQNAIKEDESKALKKAFYDRSSGAFDDFLLEEGFVSRSALLNALSEYYQVPAFDVIGYFFDHEYLIKFPKDFLLRNAIIPLEQDENILVVIAANPDNENLLPALGKYVSYDIQFMVGIEQDITDAVKEFYDESIALVPEDIDIHEEQRVAKEVEDIEHSDDEW